MMKKNSASEINRHLSLGDLEAQRNYEEKGEELWSAIHRWWATGGSTGKCSYEQQDQQMI